jgi:hypothetical protein
MRAEPALYAKMIETPTPPAITVPPHNTYVQLEGPSASGDWPQRAVRKLGGAIALRITGEIPISRPFKQERARGGSTWEALL